jgi:hypothetical protein
MNLCRYFPSRFIRYVFKTGSDPALQRVRENRIQVHRVAKKLIEQKRQEMVVGQSEKDILSLLGASPHVAPSVFRTEIGRVRFVVRANDTKDEQSKLRDDEIIAQVQTLLLVGHETVAKPVSKLYAIYHGKTSDDPRSVAHVCAMGAREADRDPAQATRRGYRCIRGG